MCVSRLGNDQIADFSASVAEAGQGRGHGRRDARDQGGSFQMRGGKNGLVARAGELDVGVSWGFRVLLMLLVGGGLDPADPWRLNAALGKRDWIAFLLSDSMS